MNAELLALVQDCLKTIHKLWLNALRFWRNVYRTGVVTHAEEIEIMRQLFHNSVQGSRSITEFLRRRLKQRTTRAVRCAGWGAVACIALALLLRGCSAPPEVAHELIDDQLQSPVAVNTKTPATGLAETKHDETDEVAHVFAVQERLEKDVDELVRRIASRMQVDDAAEIVTLHRVYTTGQFLRELDRWLDAPGRAELIGAADKQELEELKQRWSQLETLIASLAHSGI